MLLILKSVGCSPLSVRYGAIKMTAIITCLCSEQTGQVYFSQ